WSRLARAPAGTVQRAASVPIAFKSRRPRHASPAPARAHFARHYHSAANPILQVAQARRGPVLPPNPTAPPQ
ncbi:hypothetical protein PVAP13_3NG141338, partial [Panicum virgatum]